MKFKTKKEGKELTIALSGELNTLTAPELQALLDKELNGCEKVVMDFTECDYVSSAGLRVLLGTYKQMKAIKGQMYLENVGENFKEVLENVGLDAVFDIR